MGITVMIPSFDWTFRRASFGRVTITLMKAQVLRVLRHILKLYSANEVYLI